MTTLAWVAATAGFFAGIVTGVIGTVVWSFSTSDEEEKS